MIIEYYNYDIASNDTEIKNCLLEATKYDFLQLQQQASHQNFTHLALEAGYYDQAHSIREFKAFFNHCPSHLFQQNSQLLKISQDIITRRFSNAYDPRV